MKFKWQFDMQLFLSFEPKIKLMKLFVVKRQRKKNQFKLSLLPTGCPNNILKTFYRYFRRGWESEKDLFSERKRYGF